MAYNAFNDKNVLFLQGTQTNLNNLITNGGAKEGAFYLTYDTHRLYIGRNNGEKVIPIAVNEGVVTVQNVDALTHIEGVNAGEFYYAKAENILCVYNGQQFVQINVDQNSTNTELTNDIKVSDNVATITTAVTDSANKIIQDAFQIKDSSGHTLITVTGKVIDLKTDKYTLSSDVATENNASTATIVLSSENTEEDSNVKIVAGDNIDIVADGDNKFKIHSSYVNTTNTNVASELTSEGKIKVSVTDSAGQILSGESGPIIYTIGASSYIPGDTLPVYTKTEVDNILNGLNGMTYVGTIGNSKPLPTISDNIKVGDTYLVDANNKISVSAIDSYDGKSITAGKGDLLIATGTEADGIITSDLKWSYVPAGDDDEHDTTYIWGGDASFNKKTLTESDGVAAVGSWQLNAGTTITISSTGNEDLVTTINHADIQCDNTTGDDQNDVVELVVVSNIEVNGQGHVTEVQTTKYNLLDTTYSLSKADVTEVTDGVKVAHTLAGSDGSTSNSEVTITSKTLSMTAGTGDNTNAYNIDIQWGSF